MELEIVYRGRIVGSLSVERQGLYDCLSAQCEAFAPGIQRVYAVAGRSVTPLGVLSPRPGGLGFRRTVSHRSLEGKLELAAAGESRQGWLPWRGRVEGRLLNDAYLSPDGLAFPFEPGRELPLIHRSAALRFENVQGRDCLVLPRSDLQ